MANIQGLRDKYSNIEGERFFNELFTNNEYKEILSKPLDTVIDVGALAGEFGAYIYEKAGTIYAIEPFLLHFAELVENIHEFDLAKIKPFRVALADFNGEDNFKTDDSRGGNYLTSDGQQIVPVKTLATFMKDEGITHVDVLKIDIEGGEIAVFGSDDFTDVAGQIDCIIGEHFGPEVTKRLTELGFTFRDIEGANVIYERRVV